MAQCPPLLYPETEACSGRGTCANENTCLCDDPTAWTGVGDFAFGAPSCAVYMPAVQGLWAATAAVQGLFGIYAVVFIVNTYRRKEKVHFHFSNGVSRLLLGILSLLEAVALFVVGVLRATNVNTQAIGSTPAVSILFALGCWLYWTVCPLFAWNVILVTVKQTKVKRSNEQARISSLGAQFKRVLPLNWSLCTVAAIMPIAALGAKSMWQMYAIAVVHFVTLTLAILLLGGYSIIRFVSMIMNDIDDVLKSNQTPASPRSPLGNVSSASYVAAPTSPNASAAPGTSSAATTNLPPSVQVEQLSAVYGKLKFFRSQTLQITAVNSVLALLFGVWPFLQQRAISYQLPIAYISAGLVSMLMLYLSTPVRSSPSSSQMASHTSSSASERKPETTTMVKSSTAA